MTPPMYRHFPHCFIALILFMGMSDLSAQDQCNLFRSDVSDTLKVRGTWQDGSVRASGYIQFSLADNESGEIFMVASPLTSVRSKDDKIQAANVEFAGVNIQPGLPANTVLSIVAAPKPGVYTGSVIFYLAGDNACKRVMPIRAELATPNQAAVLDEALTFDIVNSDWFNFILPASLRSKGFNFRVENPGTIPVVLDGYTLSMIGTKTGRTLQSNEVVFYEWDDKTEKLSPDTLSLRGKVLPPQSDITFVCVIKRKGHLVPDTYSGRLKLRFADAATPQQVNLSMNVRAGVLGVIFVLILGIIVGRQVTRLESPEVKAQMALMPKLVKLRRDADKIKVAGAEAAAHKELDALETELNEVKGEEEEILTNFNNRFDSMGVKLSTLLALDDLDLNIHEQPLKVNKQELHEKTGRIRELIFDQEMEAVQPLIEEVTTALSDALATGGTGTRGLGTRTVDNPLTRQINKVNRSLGDLKTKDAQQKAAHTEVLNKWQKFKRWWRKIVVAVMGVSVSAGARYWFIRPMITGLFFVGFLLFGFHSLYIESGFNFGLNGLYDYFQIFIWGATTDIISRTVGGLGGLKLQGGGGR